MKVEAKGLGSFWVDITRTIIHVLIPLNLVISVLLVAGGVIQNLEPAQTVSLVEPIAVNVDGEIIENAQIDIASKTVTVNGQMVPQAKIITDLWDQLLVKLRLSKREQMVVDIWV